MLKQHLRHQQEQQVHLVVLLLRLVNTDTDAHLVTLVEEASGTVVGSFTMPAGSIEFLEKVSTYAIFAANAGVKGAAAGFTD